jgi:hypothetical protein
MQTEDRKVSGASRRSSGLDCHGPTALAMTLLRHCEERSDVAIHAFFRRNRKLIVFSLLSSVLCQRKTCPELFSAPLVSPRA